MPTPATSELRPHRLESRRDALVARLLAAGFVEAKPVSEFIRRFTGYDLNVLIPIGHPCEVEYEFGMMLDKAEGQCAAVEAIIPPTAPGPTVAELQEQLRALRAELTAERLGNVKIMCDASVAAVRVVAESTVAYERRRANEAIAQLHDARTGLRDRDEAIAALGRLLREESGRTTAAEIVAVEVAKILDADPERSPAWDDNDQPIPLVRRVEIALMPDAPGTTRIERKIKGHLDNYGVPTEYGGATVTLASRVAMVAQAWRDLRDHSPEASKPASPLWSLKDGAWLLTLAGIWLAEYRPGDCLLISGSGRYPVARHDPQDMLRRRGLPPLPSEATDHLPGVGKKVNG